MDKLLSSLENTQLKKFLLFSLASTAFAIIISSSFEKEIATSVSVLLYVIVTVPLVILSAIISKRFGIKGNHGKAWLLFTIFASLWFIAERTIAYYDLAFGKEPFPSWADFFWITAYPFLFFFLLFYLRPIKKAVSQNLVIIASLISIGVLIPTIYITYLESPDASLTDTLVAVSYPVGDAIVLVPAIIGMILFFRGEVNFLWSPMCIAIILEAIADTGFLLVTLDGHSYYKGHPVDIPFIWAYVILSFGVYHHIKIFKNHMRVPYKNVEELR